MQIGTEQQPNMGKKVEDLYHKHMALGLEAQKMNDRILSETHHQRAEHYLHLMDELGLSLELSPPSPQKFVFPINGKPKTSRKYYLRRT